MTVLNLAGAETDSTVESGQYEAEVWEGSLGEVSGNGKLPAGTPRLDVQFKLTSEGVVNRRVWASYSIAPDGYKNKAILDGMLVNFLAALGYDKTKVMGGKFDIDLEDLKARACVVVVTKEQKIRDNVPVEGEFVNNVRSVKKAGTAASKKAPGLI